VVLIERLCTPIVYESKGKAVPLHAMEALGGRGGIAPTHSEWSASRPGCAFTPGTHCTGGWVGPRAGLDTEARGKILCPCRVSNSDRPVVQPVVRHYTAWANPPPNSEPVPVLSDKWIISTNQKCRSKYILLCAPIYLKINIPLIRTTRPPTEDKQRPLGGAPHSLKTSDIYTERR
jgi:hypothetical protein